MSKIKPRPTGSSLLVATQCGLGATAIATASFFGLNVWEATASEGGLSVFCAPILGVGVAIGLVLAWHNLAKVAARASDPHRIGGVIAFSCALALFSVFGASWPMAARIGGKSALATHQSFFINASEKVQQALARRAATEAEITKAIEAAGKSFGATADSEAKGFKSGKNGQGSVYRSLLHTATHFTSKADTLTRESERREAFLRAASAARDDARKAHADADYAAFNEAAKKTASALNAANAIHLKAGDLGLGLSVAPQLQRDVNEAISKINGIAGSVADEAQEIVIPFYEVVDAKTALLMHPVPLAWGSAVFCEMLLPLTFIGLLLLAWRDEPNEGHGANVVPFDAPSRIPAE